MTFSAHLSIKETILNQIKESGRLDGEAEGINLEIEVARAVSSGRGLAEMLIIKKLNN